MNQQQIKIFNKNQELMGIIKYQMDLNQKMYDSTGYNNFIIKKLELSNEWIKLKKENDRIGKSL